MKRFQDFVNEGVEEANEDTKFLEFLEEVKNAFTKDFKRDTAKEAEAFVGQYYDVLKDSFDNGFTVREAIAATKIPGTMVTVAKLDESYIFEMDDDFENSYKELESIESEKDFERGEQIINDFYHKYYRKTFSDLRISERLKNNYKSLINIYEEKVNEIS
jgi:hypothetical protein